MRVKVVKCRNRSFWYRDAIGKVFDVEQSPHSPDDWAVIGVKFRCMEKADCKEVIEAKPKKVVAKKAVKK